MANNRKEPATFEEAKKELCRQLNVFIPKQFKDSLSVELMGDSPEQLAPTVLIMNKRLTAFYIYPEAIRATLEGEDSLNTIADISSGITPISEEEGILVTEELAAAAERGVFSKEELSLFLTANNMLREIVELCYAFSFLHNFREDYSNTKKGEA